MKKLSLYLLYEDATSCISVRLCSTASAASGTEPSYYFSKIAVTNM
jgi:hypothetical protein